MKQSNHSIHVSAPAKIHLLGEHAVVYGKPALLATINKRCFVTLTPQKKLSIQFCYDNPKLNSSVPLEYILKITDKARQLWNTYQQSQDIQILKKLIANPSLYLAIIMGETYEFFKRKPESGFEIKIQSSIPLGAGLGSSAALAVALSTALMKHLGIKKNLSHIQQIAHASEQRVHGNSSGADVAASLYGGVIFFQKLSPSESTIKPLSLTLPKTLKDNFYMIYSGKPEETTGEMVSFVRSEFEKNPQLQQEFLSSQEKITNKLISTLENGNENELMKIIHEGEKNLEKIGVTSEFSRYMIESIEQSGGAAKICGGGGKKAGTGMILVYHPQRAVIMDIAKKFESPWYTIVLGGKGITHE